MKETIYTIPINEAIDAVKRGDEGHDCFVCRLHEKLERESLEYVLGAAMMEPDVRIETNKMGFCAEHYGSMLKAQKRLSLALILQSQLEALQKKPSVKLANPHECYVCSRFGSFMTKVYANIIHLWDNSEEFKQSFDSVPMICLQHTAELLKIGKQSLGRKVFPDFERKIETRTKNALEELFKSVGVFTSSFDHRNAGMELGEHKTSVERSIKYLAGYKG